MTRGRGGGEQTDRQTCREKLECGGALKGMRALENIWKRTTERERVTGMMGYKAGERGGKSKSEEGY